MSRSSVLGALVLLLGASACEVTVRERRAVYAPPPPPPYRGVIITAAAVPPPPPTVVVVTNAPPPPANTVVVSQPPPQPPVATGGQCLRYPSPPPGTRCGYQCTVDVVRGATNCVGNVRIANLASGRGLAAIEMGQFHQLEATVTLSQAAGWSFDIGDSPTNDGFGGDGASRSNDAELFAVDGRLQVFGNDYAPPGAAKMAANVPFGVGTHTILIEDQQIRDAADGIDLCSPTLLRLSPQVDQEGPPDRTWYMSFDGVITGRGDRVGRGLDRVELCLR